MKIVFCDMSTRQAKKFLRMLGEVEPIVFDFEFGYSVMEAMVRCTPFSQSDDQVYLVNSIEALVAVMGELESGVANDCVYVLTNGCELRKVSDFGFSVVNPADVRKTLGALNQEACA